MAVDKDQDYSVIAGAASHRHLPEIWISFCVADSLICVSSGHLFSLPRSAIHDFPETTDDAASHHMA